MCPNASHVHLCCPPFHHQEFTGFLQKHDEVLTELEKASKRLKKLETVYKEFELQKVCYLPLNTFLLKPIQRLMHYKLILERLCKHYSPAHRDHDDCKGERPIAILGVQNALAALVGVVSAVPPVLRMYLHCSVRVLCTPVLY